MNDKNNIKLAIFSMILSALSFSLMQIIVKISGGNIPLMEQVFARNFITLLISLIIMIKNKERIFSHKNNIIAILSRAIFGYLGVVTFFYATNNMLLADASVLQRTSPFWATLFAFIISKEKILNIQWMALIIAIIGSIFIIKPKMNSNLTTSLIALSSAIFAGIAQATIGFLKGKESNSLIIFYFSLISCLLSLIYFKSFVMPNLYDLIALILIGIFAGLGQFFLTISCKKAPVSTVSIFNYSGVIFSYIFSIFILNEVLDAYSIFGTILTILAALTVYFYKKKEA